jgi:hypothetical protein
MVVHPYSKEMVPMFLDDGKKAGEDEGLKKKLGRSA